MAGGLCVSPGGHISNSRSRAPPGSNTLAPGELDSLPGDFYTCDPHT